MKVLSFKMVLQINTCLMAKVESVSKVEVTSKVTLAMVSKKDSVKKLTQTGPTMKVYTMTMSPMARVNINGPTETSMRACGVKDTSMEKVGRAKLMGPTTMETGSKESPKEMENVITLPRGSLTLETGWMVHSMEKERRS